MESRGTGRRMTVIEVAHLLSCTRTHCGAGGSSPPGNATTDFGTGSVWIQLQGFVFAFIAGFAAFSMLGALHANMSSRLLDAQGKV